VNVAVVGNPAKPTVTSTEPTLCGSPTGTLTVTNQWLVLPIRLLKVPEVLIQLLWFIQVARYHLQV
jgi:hypothetical protein